MGHASESKPLLKQLEVLQEMKAAEEAAEVEEEMKDMLHSAKAIAAGEAGDSGKYEKAAETVEKRWLLYLAVMGHSEQQQPTFTMFEEFAVFLFKTRQVRSIAGKTGLGDSAVLLARYTLCQKVFPMLGYEDWQGLSHGELKEKAKPYSALLEETWVRLRRAQPEMQGQACSRVCQGEVG